MSHPSHFSVGDLVESLIGDDGAKHGGGTHCLKKGAIGIVVKSPDPDAADRVLCNFPGAWNLSILPCQMKLTGYSKGQRVKNVTGTLQSGSEATLEKGDVGIVADPIHDQEVGRAVVNFQGAPNCNILLTQIAGLTSDDEYLLRQSAPIFNRIQEMIKNGEL